MFFTLLDTGGSGDAVWKVSRVCEADGANQICAGRLRQAREGDETTGSALI